MRQYVGPADRLLESIEFDMTCLFGQFAGLNRILLQGVQRFAERRREAA